MATRSMEGFFRSQNTSRGRGGAGGAGGAAASGGGGAAAAAGSVTGSVSSELPSHSAPLSAPTPVMIQTMERPSETTTPPPSRISQSGALRPPNELGRQETEEKDPNKLTDAEQVTAAAAAAGIHPKTAVARKRAMDAVNACRNPAATLFTAKAIQASKEKNMDMDDEPALFCSITYGGMEVLFAATHEPEWRVYGICARTRLVFQYLELPEPLHDDHSTRRIVAVTANQTTGLVAIALSDGAIRTYSPVPTDPTKHPFGRYRWIDGATIHSSQVFYQHNETMAFKNKLQAEPGQALILSSSRDHKLLVAHRNQLAVFDVSLNRMSTTNNYENSSLIVDAAEKEETIPAVAQLLWATSMPQQIVLASISGDGQSLAVVTDDAKPEIYDTTCGVQTFLRDQDDGSQCIPNGTPAAQSQQQVPLSMPVGIVYKQGPLLEHSEPVTKLLFQGLGHNTPNVSPGEQGNDFLLTYSEHDNMARIYGQGTWDKLVQWTTPPHSTVSWVNGASAFNLGDLETQKKVTTQTDSRTQSQNPSNTQALADEVNTTSSSPGLFPGGSRQFLHNTSLASAAGAWIAELSFCGAYPVIKLSRLSFVKRGSETMHPTLFESVSSTLPATSMAAQTILNTSDEHLSIHGIWPAWNPWLSESADLHSEETLSGSAMAFLGLSSSTSAATGGHFGESLIGGTHSPPSELRIVASHPLCGNVTMMEFALWGNRDSGELELGSALRYVLSLPDVTVLSSNQEEKHAMDFKSVEAFMDYESSRLVARLRPDNSSVSLSWQKEGTMSVYPSSWDLANYDSKSPQECYARHWTANVGILEHFLDASLVPASLSVPPIFLPKNLLDKTNGESVIELKWWPDENFGGPPVLLVITSAGTIMVYEIPPLCNALEPLVPNSVPSFDKDSGDQDCESSASMRDVFTGIDTDSNDVTDKEQKEYDVMIIPHPDFGLGLRLESQLDGLPAVAGSYKKHPLTGGKLPAEKAGMIMLGDELLSVNGIPLAGISFDEIITTVRQVGATSEPGKPLCMRFRRMNGCKWDNSTGGPEVSPDEVKTSQQSQCPTKEIIGDSSIVQSYHRSSSKRNLGALSGSSSDVGSDWVISEGTCNEAKQDFCHLVGMVRHALILPRDTNTSRFVLLPWIFGGEGRNGSNSHDTAILFSSNGLKVSASLVEKASGCNPCSVSVYEMGFTNLAERGVPSDKISETFIQSISSIDVISRSPTLVVCDNDGKARLVCTSIEPAEDGSNQFSASFQQHKIFEFGKSISKNSCIIRSISIDLIATMHYHEEEKSPTVTVWSSRPHPTGSCHSGDVGLHEYVATEVYLGTYKQLVDLLLIPSGCLDSSPLLVTMSRNEAVIYTRPPNRLAWDPVKVLTFSHLPGSSVSKPSHMWMGSIQPAAYLPHLVPALRSIAEANEEINYLRADWHPDSLLAGICTEQEGIHRALLNVQRHFVWLSKALLNLEDINDASTDSSLMSSQLPNVIVTEHLTTSEHAALSAEEEEEELLRQFQHVLSARLSLDGHLQNRENPKPQSTNNPVCVGQEKKHIPSMLGHLSSEELKMLWALGEVVLERPDLKMVDTPGELFLFALEIFRKINKIPDEENRDMLLRSHVIHNFSVKRKLVKQTDEAASFKALPSAACLSALLSNSQKELLNKCRHTGMPVDWNFVRQCKIPFWLQSDIALAKLAEEVGQTIFRSQRDTLECALFFLVARKHQMLRNLAATDQSDSGRKFLSFVTNHDFTGQRGRRAAEKNAYSLLRKRRYTAASAFFLLAEPPFLKSALEVIATHMQDLNLAFLVGRLVESNELGYGDQIGGIGNSIFMGSGGGYASNIAGSSFLPGGKAKTFDQWQPKLGNVTKGLLIDRGLAQSDEDTCFTAVQLLWLSQRQEACYWLSGLARIANNKSSPLPDVGDALPKGLLDRPPHHRSLETSPMGSNISPKLRVCYRMNKLFDFFTGPILLKTMKADRRSRLCSALHLSTSLMQCGIELSAVNVLLQETNLQCEDHQSIHKKDTYPQQYGSSEDTSIVTGSTMLQSSTLKSSSNIVGAQPESSIFDAFDVPPVQKTDLGGSQDAAMNSSIFESFDIPSKQPFNSSGSQQESHPQAADGQMMSTIFDSYGDALIKPAVSNQPQGTEMNASISDAAHVPHANPHHSGPESSIFDEFDAAPPAKSNTESSVNMQRNSNFSNSLEPSDLDQRDNRQAGEEQDARIESSLLQFEALELGSLGPTEIPELWLQLRENVLLFSAARRIIRELASLVAELYGCSCDPPVVPLPEKSNVILHVHAAEVLQLPCEGNNILTRLRDSVNKICQNCDMEPIAAVQQSLRFLSSPQYLHRLFFAVILHLSNEREDLAEDLVREAASLLINRCDAFSLGNSTSSVQSKSLLHMSSLYLRREVACISWQLELCLWLHRAGTLPLSSVAIKEAIVAVRVGYMLASWNTNYECLDTLIKCEPDCLMDNEAGRWQWASLKFKTSVGQTSNDKGGANSGGWEFLVDCRRSEATELLRDKQTGCFIIRPHAEDHGVFTLSFKTNLVPTELNDDSASNECNDVKDTVGKPLCPKPSRPVKKDDVVQHAILRLSDSGFRCGSFGPFGTLIKLLDAVSASLPFDLRFDHPPAERVIKDEGSQPSPNAIFLRKLMLRHVDSMVSNLTHQEPSGPAKRLVESKRHSELALVPSGNDEHRKREKTFGLFLELLVLTAIRKSLSAVAASDYHDLLVSTPDSQYGTSDDNKGESDEQAYKIVDDQYATAFRRLRPFLTWCRMLELVCDFALAPGLCETMHFGTSSPRITLSASETAIEAVKEVGRGDSLLRRMIKPDSGVDFRTLRLAEGRDSTVVVLFSKKEALDWLIEVGSEKDEGGALAKLEAMERLRVIEPFDLTQLQLKACAAEKDTSSKEGEVGGGVRYRIIDPWEVEALESKEGETKSAAIGRHKFLAFSLGKVASSCETIFREIGGLPALELWTSAKGGISLTKSLALVHPPWEKGSGGDLQTMAGVSKELSPFLNSIRQHLYRNSLFRHISLPQRFLALVQVELLDLKNLTVPGGSLSLTVYALLRLRRSDTGAPLTTKTRTLDSAATNPVKLAKSSGPNAAASWGSVVRFRFPLPEDVSCNGVSRDRNREILFKVSQAKYNSLAVYFIVACE